MIVIKDRQEVVIESDAEIPEILAHIENSLENRAQDGEENTPDYEDLEFLQGLFETMQATGKHPTEDMPYWVPFSLHTTAFDIFCGVVWEQLMDDDPVYWGQGVPKYGARPAWTLYGNVTVTDDKERRLMIAALHGMMDNHWDMRGEIGTDTYYANESNIEAIIDHLQGIERFPATLTMPSEAHALYHCAKEDYLPHTQLEDDDS